MHTNGHTRRKGKPAAIRHTLQRNGSIYYNRRVPSHAVEAFGEFVRVKLSRDEDEARETAERITESLNAIWKAETVRHGVDLAALVEASKPRSCTLAALTEGYLGLRRINPEPVRTAVRALLSVAGDKDIRDYTRHDARAFVAHLRGKGGTTGTIRRRVGSISAILNHGYAEFDIEKRNPFGRLLIQGEGEDATKREPFTTDELRRGYRLALRSGSHVKLLMPILGETGCRIGEIVGLRLSDIDLEAGIIRIVPHEARRLKTKGSERELPLVGMALEAIKIVAGDRRDGYLYPQYLRDGRIQATHASNAVNGWLKREFDGKTAHCLRHAFRDRLRAVECPLELIDQLGGWASVGSVGSGYGKGYGLEAKTAWLSRLRL
ncbi:MAG: tyrosine recombinase XerC [Pikeienuella sp.]|uniref:site-specific integrase n=1 Tax=Pikeienuella sp. TaxID=2831957 RepID=UPI0039187CE9